MVEKREKRGEKDGSKKRRRKNHKSYKIKILEYQTDKMAQQPAIKAEVMSWTPRIDVVEEENQFLQVFLWPSQMLQYACDFDPNI